MEKQLPLCSTGLVMIRGAFETDTGEEFDGLGTFGLSDSVRAASAFWSVNMHSVDVLPTTRMSYT